MKFVEITLTALILIIFGLTRLPFLDGGVLIVEPDERSYHAATESLKNERYPPKIVGTYFFDQVPIFEYFSLPLTYIFKDMTLVYFLMKVVNAFISSLILIPAFP